MREIVEQYKKGGNLHHLHILVGDREVTKNSLTDFCQKDLGCDIHSPLDFFNQEFDRFLVEHSLEIIDRAMIKTSSGKKMVFALSLNEMTTGAQNALLKIIEEPTADTYFFFIVPRSDIFLPTILSRAVVVSNKEEGSAEDILKELRSKSIGERVKWADDLAKKIKDGKVERGEARKVVKQMMTDLEKTPENLNTLKTLQMVDEYLGYQGSSVKLLMEKVVLDLGSN